MKLLKSQQEATQTVLPSDQGRFLQKKTTIPTTDQSETKLKIGMHYEQETETTTNKIRALGNLP